MGNSWQPDACDRRKDALTPRLQGHPDSMARYSGGTTTHRALTGPRRTGSSLSSEEAWKQEVLLTLTSIQEIRQKCDRTELRTVREARKAGLSWTEIAIALGVTRQSAWERWHELDETRQAASQ